MNKWMVRFWGLLALVSLAMLVATTAWPVAPNPQLASQRALLEMLQEPELRGVVAGTDGSRARGFEDWKSRAPQVPAFRGLEVGEL